jgi:hypothetical protein
MSERWWSQPGKHSASRDLAPYLSRLDAIDAWEGELRRLGDGAALVCWPLLLAWGAAKHWRRRRERASQNGD